MLAARKLFSKIVEQETLLVPRTVLPEVVPAAPEVVDDWKSSGEKFREEKKMPEEQGFTYKGHEPTMFGDWQHKGRTTDF